MKFSFFKYIKLTASKSTNMNYLSVLFFTQGVSKIKVLIPLKCYKNIYVTGNSEILHYDRLKNYL